MKINVKIQGKTFTVKLGDIQARPIQAEVEGEIFEVWPEETTAPSETSISVSSTPQVIHSVPVVKMGGAATAQEQKSNSIVAPIPGVIVEIDVKVGDSVSYGQELCALEAMKMKNSIRSNCDGVIKEILVNTGEHVHQSQVLMKFEEKGK